MKTRKKKYDYEKNSRIEKCKKQKIFLLQINEISDTEKTFEIQGSTGNVYTVKINNELSCNCPDYIIRRNRCKHIYFVLIRILKCENTEEDYFEDDDLIEMFNNMPKITKLLMAKKKDIKKYNEFKNESKEKKKKKKKKKEKEKEENEEENENVIQQKEIDKDDDCPICLEKLLNDEEIVYCKYSCGKSIHKICMNKWINIKGPICVYCRGDWLNIEKVKKKKKKKIKKGRWNYINIHTINNDNLSNSESESDQLYDEDEEESESEEEIKIKNKKNKKKSKNKSKKKNKK